MTDNEIIKALECCSSNATGNEYCKDCPYNIYEYCGEESSKDTLDLINRQKEEIERLTEALDGETVENMRLKHDIEILRTNNNSK